VHWIRYGVTELARLEKEKILYWERHLDGDWLETNSLATPSKTPHSFARVKKFRLM